VFAFADTTGPGIPAGSSVELYLLGDPDLRTIQPAYGIDGGTLTNFGAAYAPSDSMRWFSTQAQVGVLASSQLGQEGPEGPLVGGGGGPVGGQDAVEVRGGHGPQR
jgi:hypothetical protein